MDLLRAQVRATALLRRLEQAGVRACIVGSIRRQKPIVGDLDFVVSDMAKTGEVIGIPISADRRKLSCELDGVDVQFFRAEPQEWAATLLFTTGNKMFNIIIRARAKKLGLLLNQYGLWDAHGNLLAYESEQAILHALGMKWYTPQQREK